PRRGTPTAPAARAPRPGRAASASFTPALRAEGPADHLVEQPRTDVPVPLVTFRPGRDLVQVPPHDAPPRAHPPGDERRGLGERQPARHRRPGVGTEGGLE